MKALKRTFNFINEHPLAKRHLFRAYLNFFWWQLVAMLIKDWVKISYIDNTKFYAKKGLTGVTGNIYCGLHEFEDMSFLLHILRSEDTFYDIGANVGAYSILASGVKRSKTIAFEPIEASSEILNRNVQLNHLEKRITVLNYGVGSENQMLSFTKDQDTTNHVSLHPNLNTIELNVVKLDNYILEHNPILLKIDVEGFELEVLKGAVLTLKNDNLKAIIIELNGSGLYYGINDSEIHDLLTINLFKPYEYDPFTRILIEKPSFGSFNTIYIRDINFVKDRIKNSDPFNIFGEKI